MIDGWVGVPCAWARVWGRSEMETFNASLEDEKRRQVRCCCCGCGCGGGKRMPHQPLRAVAMLLLFCVMWALLVLELPSLRRYCRNLLST